MSHDPSTCEICPEGVGEPKGHGWQIQGVTHCRGCGDTWRGGTNMNHCLKCHITFATLDAGYRLHTDSGHRHPTKVGLISQTNAYGTEVWGTQEGFDNSAAKAERFATARKRKSDDNDD